MARFWGWMTGKNRTRGVERTGDEKSGLEVTLMGMRGAIGARLYLDHGAEVVEVFLKPNKAGAGINRNLVYKMPVDSAQVGCEPFNPADDKFDPNHFPADLKLPEEIVFALQTNRAELLRMIPDDRTYDAATTRMIIDAIGVMLIHHQRQSAVIKQQREELEAFKRLRVDAREHLRQAISKFTDNAQAAGYKHHRSTRPVDSEHVK